MKKKEGKILKNIVDYNFNKIHIFYAGVQVASINPSKVVLKGN